MGAERTLAGFTEIQRDYVKHAPQWPVYRDRGHCGRAGGHGWEAPWKHSWGSGIIRCHWCGAWREPLVEEAFYAQQAQK